MTQPNQWPSYRRRVGPLRPSLEHCSGARGRRIRYAEGVTITKQCSDHGACHHPLSRRSGLHRAVTLALSSQVSMQTSTPA